MLTTTINEISTTDVKHHNDQINYSATISHTHNPTPQCLASRCPVPIMGQRAMVAVKDTTLIQSGVLPLDTLVILDVLDMLHLLSEDHLVW